MHSRCIQHFWQSLALYPSLLQFSFAGVGESSLWSGQAHAPAIRVNKPCTGATVCAVQKLRHFFDARWFNFGSICVYQSVGRDNKPCMGALVCAVQKLRQLFDAQ